MKIKRYLEKIDYSKFKDDEIFAVLYNYKTKSHLYLFNIEEEDGKKFCTMMSEPVSKEFPYVEMSLPYLDDIDRYYKTCRIIPDSHYIKTRYKKVRYHLKGKEARLLERQ